MHHVSIIASEYNVEKYLGQCINSLTKQSYPSVSIILIDDGLTDCSPIIGDE